MLLTLCCALFVCFLFVFWFVLSFLFFLSHSCYALGYAHPLHFYLSLIFLSFMYFLSIKLHFKYTCIHYISIVIRRIYSKCFILKSGRVY